MSLAFIQSGECPKCGNPLAAVALHRQPQPAACPSCQAELHVEVFPRFFVAPAVQGGERLTQQDHATCFFHPNKVAQSVCQECGRFVCGLCEMEVMGRRLCVKCLEDQHQQQKINVFTERRSLHDNMLMSLAVLPLLMWPLTVISGPMTVILTLWWWRKAHPLARRTKPRMAVAGVIGLAETVAWLFGGVYFLA